MIKLPPRENWFQYILGLTALFVASVAAFFSIVGIGMLFSGAAISSMVMASSLELGKVVATTFLYRYWKTATNFLRIYLMGAIAILVVITSAGVFGWLSSAYQSSAMQYEINQQQVAALVDQKGVLQTQAEQAKQRINNLSSIRNDQEKRMNEALNNPALSRNPTALRQVQEQNISLIKQTDADMGTETGRYNEFIKGTIEMDKKILDTKMSSSKTKDIITFKFVADELGWELNKTVKWFIIFIIVVFDPLAICLILAYNVATYGSKPVEKPIEPDRGASAPPPPPLKMLLNEKRVETESPMVVPPVTEVAPVESVAPTVVEPPASVPVEPPSAPAPASPPVQNHGLRDYEMYHSPTR